MNKNNKSVPLVITHHLLLKSVGTISHKHLFLLFMVKEFKTVYTPAPTVSFNSSRKLTSYIVRIELYLLVRSVGPFKYKKPLC